MSGRSFLPQESVTISRQYVYRPCARIIQFPAQEANYVIHLLLCASPLFFSQSGDQLCGTYQFPFMCEQTSEQSQFHHRKREQTILPGDFKIWALHRD